MLKKLARLSCRDHRGTCMNIEKDGFKSVIGAGAKQDYSSPFLTCYGRVSSITAGGSGNVCDKNCTKANGKG